MSHEQELAGRGSRLWAVGVDGLVAMLFVVVAIIIFRVGTGDAALLVGILGGLAAYGVVQAVLLSRDGQTIGKKIARVRIVMVSTGENGGFGPNVLLRFVVNTLLGIIPLYGLVDALFIFRGDRRCLHDHIAKTRVVRA